MTRFENEQWLGVDLCFQNFEKELDELPGCNKEPERAIFLAKEGWGLSVVSQYDPEHAIGNIHGWRPRAITNRTPPPARTLPPTACSAVRPSPRKKADPTAVRKGDVIRTPSETSVPRPLIAL